MELRQLRTFAAVARTMNFTAAAKELHFAQSTVSEQIQNLERELGMPLFDRSNRQLALTGPGHTLHEYAERIAALADEAQRAVVDAPVAASQLNVGALETLTARLLPSVLNDYRLAYPSIRVTVKRGNRAQLYAAVSRRQMDVCLTFGASPAKFGLDDVTLTREPLVVIVSRDHELSATQAAPIGRLLDESFLVTAPGCGFREMYDSTLATLGSAGGVRHPAAEPVLEVDSVDALIACVASGMGCGLLPEVAVLDAVERGQVSRLGISDLTLDVPITLSRLKDASPRPHVDGFGRQFEAGATRNGSATLDPANEAPLAR